MAASAPTEALVSLTRECCDRNFYPHLGFRGRIGYHDRSNVIGGAAGGNVQPKKPSIGAGSHWTAQPIAIPKWWFCSYCKDG